MAFVLRKGVWRPQYVPDPALRIEINRNHQLASGLLYMCVPGARSGYTDLCGYTGDLAPTNPSFKETSWGRGFYMGPNAGLSSPPSPFLKLQTLTVVYRAVQAGAPNLSTTGAQIFGGRYSYPSSSPYGTYSLYTDNGTGDYWFNYNNAGTANFVDLKETASQPTNGIVDLVATMPTNSAALIYYYFNGTTTPQTGSSGVTSVSYSSTSYLMAGPYGPSTATAYNNTIDLKYQVYDRALTADEVAWLYAEPFAMLREKRAPQLFYYAAAANDAAGAPVADAPVAVAAASQTDDASGGASLAGPQASGAGEESSFQEELIVQIANRVRETTTTTGTGAITCGGAVTGYRSFASAKLTTSFPYYLNDANGNWEEGRGTYNSGNNTITRIVEDSSNGGAAISLSGNAIVGLDMNAGALNELIGSPSPVSPASFPNLALWLDAANATPSQWTDTSGAGNNATQATAANQPTITASAINGLPAVTFNGTSSYYSNAYTGEPATVLVVHKISANYYGYMGIMGANTSASGVVSSYQLQPGRTQQATPTRMYSRSTLLDTSTLTSWQAGSSPCTGVWDIMGFTNDGTEITLYNGTHQCGSPSYKPNAALAPITTPVIGVCYYNGAMGNWFSGDIAEIIVYSSALTAQQYRQVAAWLAQKYAITEPVGTYLCGCFNANGANENGSNQSLCLLVSNDGLTWNHRPSNYIPFDGIAVRDVGSFYYNGALWICHTASNASVLNYFVLAKSTDGFNFNFVANIDCSAIAGTTAGSAATWAPDFFLDSDGSVHIVVAVSSSENVSPYQFYICETHPTSADWTQWSVPVAFSLPAKTSTTGGWVIDPFMVKIGATYYLWVADATSSSSTEAVGYYTSTSLTGTWSLVESGNWAGFGEPYEGQSLVNTGGSNWRIFLDADGTGYYTSTSTDNFSTWSAPVAITAPFIPQHGSVILMPQSFFQPG